jgi:pimeloyl-ACP methyl ester carboxylesterase
VTASPDLASVRRHRVVGPGGCALHVRDHGRPDAPALVFLHGLGFNGLVWHRQVEAFAAHRRVVTVDLRGHGLSGKPHDDSYSDPDTWAGDVAAVLDHLAPRSPVLVGWSYSGMVVGDYLRRHGTSGVAGVGLVAPVRKIGTADAVTLLDEQFLGLVGGLLSTDRAASLEAARAFVALARAGAWSESEAYELLGTVLSVPPPVITAMLAREQDNDEVWQTSPVPLLLAYGTADSIICSRSAEQLADLVPNVQVMRCEGVGHSLFAERADQFNDQLETFADSCQ